MIQIKDLGENMIILITYTEKNKLGRTEEIVSHGIDSRTFKNVILSQDPISYYVQTCGAFKCPNHGWCMPSHDDD